MEESKNSNNLNTTLKILFPFVGDSVGGSHHSSIILMKNLSKYGIESIAFIHKEGALKDFLLARKVNFIFINLPYWKEKKFPLLNVIQTLLITPFIIFKLKDLNIDIVHINDGTIRNTWTLAAKILNKRVIFHQRTIFDNSRLSYLLLFLPEKIIAISNFVQESLPHRFDEKTEVIYNPFIPIKSSSKLVNKINLCKKFCLNDRDYILSFIGSVTKQKRPFEAIKTLHKLKEKGINSTLLYVGKVSFKDKKLLEKEARKYNLEKKIRILGYKKNVAPFLKGSDFIIAPAINEGFGRVLIEGMLSKTLVIASNHGGHKEIIKHKVNGILTKPNSPYVMANEIQDLINDKISYDRIVKNALKFALKNYSINMHLDSIIKIYLKKK